jgi:hypothetical protein
VNASSSQSFTWLKPAREGIIFTFEFVDPLLGGRADIALFVPRAVHPVMVSRGPDGVDSAAGQVLALTRFVRGPTVGVSESALSLSLIPGCS